MKNVSDIKADNYTEYAEYEKLVLFQEIQDRLQTVQRRNEIELEPVEGLIECGRREDATDAELGPERRVVRIPDRARPRAPKPVQSFGWSFLHWRWIDGNFYGSTYGLGLGRRGRSIIVITFRHSIPQDAISRKPRFANHVMLITAE